ncbi:MAG: TonB-dependent receptor, partial [Bacteroidetes bacterium]
SYGDATGGIISVTTRGPSKDFSGGVELATSELLDSYGYNLGAFDISGPIFTKKDSLGKKSGQPVAGFFIAGEYQYDKDPDPSAIPIYVVKPEILSSIEENPLRPAPTGLNFIHRAHYFTYDSLDEVKARPNVAAKNFRLNGKLDFRPAKNLNLTFGGSFDRSDSRTFIDIYSLMNSDNNPQFIATNWRAFGKVTQNFTSQATEKAGSSIKLSYYTLQFDYSKRNTTDQNAIHKDNIFDYGYVGKFVGSGVPAYELQLLGTNQDSMVLNQIGVFDTSVVFTPGAQNPTTTNYTRQYYELSEPLGTIGYTNNLSAIENRGGLLNRDNRLPLQAYSLFATPGRVRNFYGVTDQSQVRVSASGAADIKNHSIVMGIEYEQRTDRSYGVSASSIWSLMRQLGNNRITGIDPNSAVVTQGTLGSTPVTYVNYTTALYAPSTNIDGDVAPGFYENLRNHLGLAMTDTVQTDAIDPSQYSLDLFSADELFTNGLVNYYGYDYKGNKQSGTYSLEDFFTDKDASNNYTRNIDAFRPNYMAGYIQDKFIFNDLIFNVGVRVDRFDANQKVLKDKYIFYQTYQAGDAKARELGEIPGNIGNDYYVYVNNSQNPTSIVGFRSGDNWFDAQGAQITDLSSLVQTGGSSSGIQPYLVNYDDFQNSRLRSNVFEDYTPQVSVMPRVAFSFPISDEAYFAAHYDVLTQRPQSISLLRFNPISYFNLAQGQSATVSNPDLKPEKTTDYEITFQQKLTRSSALSISAFYKELRDMIQIINVQFAHPISYSTYGNIDFGTVKGLSFAYDLRRTSNVRMNVSYTLQFADGTGSDPNTSAGILAQQGQNNLREIKPLSFDQRHTFVTSFDYHYGSGKDYDGPVWGGKQVFANAGANIVFRAGSGTPYTRKSNVTPEADFTTAANSRSVISGSLNGSRLPWSFKIDAKFDKNFEIKFGKTAEGQAKRSVFANVYFQILNVLNTQNVEVVYRATGNPDDDGYLASPAAQASIANQVSPQAYIDMYEIAVNNPGNYNLPRRMRFGVQLNF